MWNAERNTFYSVIGNIFSSVRDTGISKMLSETDSQNNTIAR